MASQEYSQDKNRSRFEDIVRYANAQLNLYEELLNARTEKTVKMASQEYSQDKNRSRFEDIVRYANAQLNLYEELLNARTEKMRQIVSQLTDNFLKCFGPPSNPGVVHQAGIYL